ncbi:MAG: hypothetical protein FVQ82_15520 [Planctomycetes bacterium]|nr:hypothetical protein [Planctomycetota bacterium]
MNKFYTLFLLLTLTVLSGCSKDLQLDDSARITELDNYWAEVSRCVKEGDYAGYKATCHKDGVLVSGSSDKAYPLSKALVRWKQDFTDAKSGITKTNVEFRFSKRYGDNTTAHETGMFLYTKVDAEGKKTKNYIHLEALLLKRGRWKIMMEYQKSKGTEEEWNKLK